MRPGPRLDCNPVSGSILPYSALCVSCPSVSFISVLWNRLLATNWYDLAVSTGSTASGAPVGVCCTADPILGSSVKNDFPKLTATSGIHQDSLGKNVSVAFGEFSPTNVLQESAGVTRSRLSMKISSRLKPT